MLSRRSFFKGLAVLPGFLFFAKEAPAWNNSIGDYDGTNIKLIAKLPGSIDGMMVYQDRLYCYSDEIPGQLFSIETQ